MTRAPITCLLLAIAGATACKDTSNTGDGPTDDPDKGITLAVQPAVQGLDLPVMLTAPPNDPRLFIVEQSGHIRVFKNGSLLGTPFLDMRSRISFSSERGLLSMAFDPAYATNGRFYIYYTDVNGDIVVERRTASSDPDIATAAFENVITIPHRDNANHNGGLVTFGPDGLLYIGTGDGGGGGDAPNNAQNTNVLLGKILRLNVSSLPYTIPAGNPFASGPGADEIWAYGLRNPWRFTFDGTGAGATLLIGDVGQDHYEEVDANGAATAGRNYGWHVMEGTHCYNPSAGCSTTGLTQPVREYSHDDGCAVIGGFVYRGAAIPGLSGTYFYSDLCGGWLRSFRFTNGAATDDREWSVGNLGNVQAFGRDGFGELYILTGDGVAYKLVKQ
ncbi:MAG TPA: PQQ-dependent sugar dehydrogenase [Gemmatimonadaceae bacterium]|nr:PQQ-dependent sugar dehydrogenase [Gemmatimonadaceae bacterium]